MLHGTPWAYMYSHCHQMTTQAWPKVPRARGKRSMKITKTDAFSQPMLAGKRPRPYWYSPIVGHSRLPGDRTRDSDIVSGSISRKRVQWSLGLDRCIVAVTRQPSFDNLPPSSQKAAPSKEGGAGGGGGRSAPAWPGTKAHLRRLQNGPTELRRGCGGVLHVAQRHPNDLVLRREVCVRHADAVPCSPDLDGLQYPGTLHLLHDRVPLVVQRLAAPVHSRADASMMGWANFLVAGAWLHRGPFPTLLPPRTGLK